MLAWSLLCIPNWTQAQDPPASASLALELKVYTPCSAIQKIFLNGILRIFDFYLCVCAYTRVCCVCEDAHSGQKRELEPLELGAGAIGSFELLDVSAGN